MESLLVLLVVVVLGAAQLITQSSAAPLTVERPDHWCGAISDGTVGECDEGRCCSMAHYCGDGLEYCSSYTCVRYCPLAPPPSDQGEAAGTLMVVTAMHNHYLDHHHAIDDEVDTINASSSSSSPVLSCATSLSRMSLSSLDQYPWAALSLASRNENITTYCGRCLKVTNLEVGGVQREAKVRVVHEANNEGLELDLDTFNNLLDIDGHDSIADRLLVKYEFETC